MIVKIVSARGAGRRGGISAADQSSSKTSRLVRNRLIPSALPAISNTSPGSRRISVIVMRGMRERLCTPMITHPVSVWNPLCEMVRPLMREAGATTTSASVRPRCGGVASVGSAPSSRSVSINGRACARASVSAERVAATMTVSPGRRATFSNGGNKGRSPR